MAEQPGLGFGGLLRQLRDDAGLTKEELAEAARVRQRAVSDLERGINRIARKDTAAMLAGALGLDGRARELFVLAARPADGHRPALYWRPPTDGHRGVCGGPGAAGQSPGPAGVVHRTGPGAGRTGP